MLSVPRVVEIRSISSFLAPDCQTSNPVVCCYYRTTIVGGQVDWLAFVSLGHFSSVAEIAQSGPAAILVSGVSELYAYRQLIVELVEKSHLPAMYPSPARDWVEAGGLMAYGTDYAELWRRHEFPGG